MSSWNHDFNQALNELTVQWINTMTEAIELGKSNGSVRSDVNARQVTMFVLSGYWGIRYFGKLERSRDVYLPYLGELKNYLESLRAVPARVEKQ